MESETCSSPPDNFTTPAVTQFKYAEAARKFNHQYPAGLASHTGKKINLGAYGADSLPVGDEPLAPAGWSSVQWDQRPRREYLSVVLRLRVICRDASLRVMALRPATHPSALTCTVSIDGYASIGYKLTGAGALSSPPYGYYLLS